MTPALPKAIFFDMDGTILDWETNLETDWRAACERGCAHLDGLSAPTLFEAVTQARTEFWHDPVRATAGRMDLDLASRTIVADAMASLGHADPDGAAAIAADYRARRDAAIVPFPGAIETLQALRERGVRMALITNGAAKSQRRNVERFGLAPYFDCVVIEGEFGCGKPDERVFVHAMASCGVEPGDTWMVGDYIEADIVTPVRLGMHAVWVDGGGYGLPAGSAATPHRIVRSIAELV